MDNQPWVSIIVPTCDRCNLLRTCLNQINIGLQSFNSRLIEVIVSDDSSDEASRMVVMENFERMTWMAGPQCGPAANRNRAARAARGEWLALVDDDCIPSKHWLAAFVEAIVDGMEIYEGKTVCSEGIFSPRYEAPINLSGGYLWSCNFFIRRSLFLELGGFDESYPFPFMEDVDFRERIKDLALTWKFVPEALVDHPPRKAAFGARKGAQHESYFLFWYKRGNRGSIFGYLMWRIFCDRLKAVLKNSLGVDSLVALGSMVMELRHVYLNGRRWESRYRAKYDREGNASINTAGVA